MYTIVYAFIGTVVVIGAGIGFYLQKSLGSSNQNIKLPSAFGAKK